MKRDIYQKLLAWKSSPRRKPLLLKGARQVGKTYILKRFGEQEYDFVAYLNFEEDPLLDDFFIDSLAPEKILKNLSLYLKHNIAPETELYYWKNDGAAEVDFLYEHRHEIFPLEAKAGINPRSKSLAFYAQKYNAPILSRATPVNLKHDGNVQNYPLYAISLFPKLAINLTKAEQ